MAATEVRDVHRASWAQRLGGSFKGVLLGVVLFLLGFPVLFKNEGWSVATARRLSEGAGAVVSVAADHVDDANEGKLVHVSGRAVTEETLEDAAFGVSSRALRLARKVEVFQWVEKETRERFKEDGKEKERITYSYAREWCPRPVDSQGFKEQGHENTPAVLPYGNEEWTARVVTLGAFTLSPADVSSVSRSGAEPYAFAADYKVPLEGAQFLNGVVYVPHAPVSAAIAAPTDSGAASNAVAAVTNAAANAVANVAARSVAERPEIGDLRVTFEMVPQHDVSIVERQQGRSFVPWRASDGKTIALVSSGLRSAEEMFAGAQSGNRFITWLLRLGGFLLMFVGLKLVLGPLVALVDVIPVLNGVVKAGVSALAFLTAAAFALVTIAVAWIAYRPVLGISLLVAAGVLAGLVVAKKRAAAAK